MTTGNSVMTARLIATMTVPPEVTPDPSDTAIGFAAVPDWPALRWVMLSVAPFEIMHDAIEAELERRGVDL